ncbi:TPA: hypothetical protein HA265_01930 [Candidatus Woesearchaeota archaeon]|nr:hypothetical protein [Candidatus Woesearchaeota archaeon]
MRKVIALILIVALLTLVMMAGCTKRVPVKPIKQPSVAPSEKTADAGMKTTVTDSTATQTAETQVTDLEADLAEVDSLDEDFNTAELDALDKDLDFEI